jgi:putative redox protein
MALESKVTWRGGLAFDADIEGFHLTLDADPQFGGRGMGPKPKALTLTSLAGCTGMDVMAILGKMRITVDSFDVSASGNLAEEHPKKYEHIVLRYSFEGRSLPLNKLRRAVQLSEERYCGIRATLMPTVNIATEIYVNGELLTAEAA